MNQQLFCAHCKDEIVSGGVACISTEIFHVDCGLRICDYWEDGKHRWKYIPDGLFPIYENGDIIKMIPIRKPTINVIIEQEELKPVEITKIIKSKSIKVETVKVETVKIEPVIKRKRGRPRIHPIIEVKPINVDKIINMELKQIENNNEEK